MHDLSYIENYGINLLKNNPEIKKTRFIGQIDNYIEFSDEILEKIFSEISKKYPHHLFSHYCLAISLKKQNKMKDFLEIQKLVASLVNNPASVKMFAKYSYMIPDFLQVMELDNWIPTVEVSKNLASEKLTIF